MRKLALDVGSKQIGVAVSDPSNTLAQPLKTIFRSNIAREAKEIKSLIEAYKIREIIAGMPIDLKGRHAVAARNTEKYLIALEEKIGMKIKRIDERLTTKIAENILKNAGLKRKKRKEVVDKLAATIILQNVLEHEKAQ